MQTNKTTLVEFIAKANAIHKNFYTYDKAIYINSKIKLTITCPVHGDFEQIPNSHLRGVKCPSCAIKQRSEKRKTPIQNFISQAEVKHNYFYTYTKVNYVNSHTKITITCPTHGDFLQAPYQHLAGNGCKQCAYTNNTFTWEGWETSGLKSSNFTGFKTYIIECWNDTERFIKIGKTFTSIALRYSGTIKLPYHWKVLDVYEGDAEYISALEVSLHNSHISLKYTPALPFKGSANECFSSYLPQKD